MREFERDEVVAGLLEQARNVQLPPPRTSPHFVLARAGRKREQRRAMALGATMCLAAVLFTAPFLGLHRSPSESATRRFPSADAPPMQSAEETVGAKSCPSASRVEPIPHPPPVPHSLQRPAAQPYQDPRPHPSQRTPSPAARPSPGVRVTTLLAAAETARNEGQCVRVGQLLERARVAGASPGELLRLTHCSDRDRPLPTAEAFGGRK